MRDLILYTTRIFDVHLTAILYGDLTMYTNDTVPGTCDI